MSQPATPAPEERTHVDWRRFSYPATILPSVLGILAGCVVVTVGLDGPPPAQSYMALPEFDLWRFFMVAQFATYAAVSAYLLVTHRTAVVGSERLGTRAMTALATVIVIIIPGVGPLDLPLPFHRWRLIMATLIALLAMLLLTDRLARAYSCFARGPSEETHVRAQAEVQTLLAIAGVVVTLGSLSVGALTVSLVALQASYPGYQSPLGGPSVIAYGGYNSLLLSLLFLPVYIVERRAAEAIRDKSAKHLDAKALASLEDELGLTSSFSERLRSSVVVFSPLIAALMSKFFDF